ncbi:hypothetical protein INR77_11915 [Erythrobacter sp. SCSIO 43205]|uniref:hypothetical protein n=1 Tax=Erythrobacter sp. SCSIO 43205 TaxID=2779361 RepID=UPI001CA8EB62|nr:hypothetical protein [Erythrobacter sp. SCSIO 43205]UAB77500.1 hypothetical protein INR77_11915 [Erythrobacter sp. SCSIO 43205]
MTLSHGDDYPLHQTPDPIAFAGTDRNFYDRYFFNGYAPDGSGFFALAFGVYPHLDVADAHFSFIRDGKQYSLHASCELGMERMAMRVGPISIEVVEPLQKLRVTIDETEGLAGAFEFTGRSFPIEEPRFVHRIGPRAFMDYTRMTQNGHFTGWIALDGDRHEMAKGTAGTRDRSWGIRPVGARDPQPNPGHEALQFFWQWTPINLEDGSLFFHINADSHGNAWNTRAAFAPDGAGANGIVEGSATLSSQTQAGSRWPAGGVLSGISPAGAPQELTLVPLHRFQMKGLGYTHPVWGHGNHHGALKVEREEYDLERIDPAQLDNRHVQLICRVEDPSGARKGIGVFEQLVLGPYAPLGLEGI